MTIDDVLQLLYDSSIGEAMRESALLFPLIETAHVLALTAVVGSIAVLDLRLLGLASSKRPVSKIVSDVLQADKNAITPDSSPENMTSWDSVQHLNLVLALEEEYGLQFLPEEMDQMKTVGEIAELVAAKRAA